MLAHVHGGPECTHLDEELSNMVDLQLGAGVIPPPSLVVLLLLGHGKDL